MLKLRGALMYIQAWRATLQNTEGTRVVNVCISKNCWLQTTEEYVLEIKFDQFYMKSELTD